MNQSTKGFTLIELIIFIVILAIVAGSILLASRTVLRGAPVSHNQTIADQAVARCMELYLSQRANNGYASITASNPIFSSLCTVPAGFTINASVNNTIIAPDVVANYKTITVTVGGASSATLSLLVASY